MPFKKGHPGYKKKGTKHKDTLLKEERRAIFDAKISEKWEQVIDQLRPEYVADQYMGKPEENLTLKTELKKEDKEKLQNLEKQFDEFIKGNSRKNST